MPKSDPTHGGPTEYCSLDRGDEINVTMNPHEGEREVLPDDLCSLNSYSLPHVPLDSFQMIT